MGNILRPWSCGSPAVPLLATSSPSQDRSSVAHSPVPGVLPSLPLLDPTQQLLISGPGRDCSGAVFGDVYPICISRWHNGFPVLVW